MSTPISDLPPVVDDDSSYVSAVQKPDKGMFSKYKDYLVLFIVVIVALKIPLDTFRYRVPQQVFALGDAPIQALLVVVLFIILNLIMKNMSF